MKSVVCLNIVRLSAGNVASVALNAWVAGWPLLAPLLRFLSLILRSLYITTCIRYCVKRNNVISILY